ncbi:hypothetical protein B0H11DRAFT_2219277 [Mycena galericulata]|nr:hypothetical protein B0H11DRAFT_2219277 [Mycena galericulata]
MSTLDPGSTLGALQIGVLIAYLLMGATTTQAYVYYGRFPGDSRRLKVLVAFVWACDAAHASCIGQTVYQQGITDYTHPERLDFLHKPLVVSILFNGLVGACVQGFFSFRIYSLSKSLYIPIFTGILSVSRVLFCVLAVVYGTRPNLTLQGFFQAQANWMPYTLWIVSTVTDLIIAAAMVHWLLRQRHSLKNHARTVAIVDKIIIWTIQTGVLTSASTTLTLVLFVTRQTDFTWFAASAVTPGLFSHSLLASLNSRATLRAMNVDEITLPPSAPNSSVSSFLLVGTEVITHRQTINFAPADIEMSKTSYALD